MQNLLYLPLPVLRAMAICSRAMYCTVLVSVKGPADESCVVLGIVVLDPVGVSFNPIYTHTVETLYFVSV